MKYITIFSFLLIFTNCEAQETKLLLRQELISDLSETPIYQRLTKDVNGQKNGKLKGTSFCYAPDDGKFCPSIKYNTTLTVENWKLKHFTSEEINKTVANNGYK